MGRLDEEGDDQDWNEPEDQARPVELDDDFDAGDEPADVPSSSRVPPAGVRRLVARRLIEQTREARELSRRLADFEDYLV